MVKSSFRCSSVAVLVGVVEGCGSLVLVQMVMMSYRNVLFHTLFASASF
jgi:hypothetical protein